MIYEVESKKVKYIVNEWKNCYLIELIILVQFKKLEVQKTIRYI
jgi:hypothetical protein